MRAFSIRLSYLQWRLQSVLLCFYHLVAINSFDTKNMPVMSIETYFNVFYYLLCSIVKTFNSFSNHPLIYVMSDILV